MIIKRGLIDITSFSLATALGYSVLGTITIPAIIMFTNNIREDNTAGHITAVSKAADSYLKDKKDILLANTTATTPFTLDVATLKNAGYLRAGFSEKNNRGQGYHVRIYQPASGQLHMMTFTTGGSELDWDEAERIAQRIDNGSGKGGYISGTTAKGAVGAWNEALSAFGNYNPGENHLVVANFYAESGANNDFLHRGAIDGHPEVNQMRTAIDMNGNNVNNAKEVTATGAVTTDEWFRTNGDTGWYSNKHGGGWHMTDDTWIRAYNGKSIQTDGQLKAGNRITTDEYVQLGKIEVAGTACASNGLVSRDANGGALFCQSGAWSEPGIGDVYYSQKSGWHAQNIGKHKFCALGTIQNGNWGKEGPGPLCSVQQNANGEWIVSGQMDTGYVYSNTDCRAICF
ncbi:shufflon system plasmid conjugative transfer pilus tip adhesin PilV [Pectobacterium carotovorum]|uniref:shufflon system plasmid conjugative transfer pilus tip adhesin PilV n=1 Tax=Pectobacterium carotovorum TaxID=554 RepID=UPI0009140846|nr:shufflon system plasmid conjugative transfer pilus tip adhesin PilV [Pectobacterium carotovorum]SHH69346.1 shufflon protein, N-terminal constant region [Pectobacterium carotovorum]